MYPIKGRMHRKVNEIAVERPQPCRIEGAMERILHPGLFYGTRLKRLESGGFMVTESEYTCELRTPPHSHEYAYLALTLEGNWLLTRGVRDSIVRVGTVVFHPPAEIHQDHFSGEQVRLLHVEITQRRLKEIHEHFALVDFSLECATPKATWLGSNIHAELRQMDTVSPLAIEGLVLELLADISRSVLGARGPKPPGWLQRANELINARFTERLTLGDIAKIVNVHPGYLAHEFHRFYRSTVGARIRQLRIQYAARAISESNRPIAEIALSSGFYDQSHFSKTFKNLTGATPCEFRKRRYSC